MGTRLAVAAAIIALAAGDAHVAEAKPSEFCGVDWICSPTTREVCGENADGVQTTRNNKCEAHCYGEVVERDGACLADLQARFDACAKFKDQEVRPSPSPSRWHHGGFTHLQHCCNVFWNGFSGGCGGARMRIVASTIVPPPPVMRRRMFDAVINSVPGQKNAVKACSDNHN